MSHTHIVSSVVELIEVTFKVFRWPVMVFKWLQAQETLVVEESYNESFAFPTNELCGVWRA